MFTLRHNRGTPAAPEWAPIDGHEIVFMVDKIERWQGGVLTRDSGADLSVYASITTGPSVTDDAGRALATVRAGPRVRQARIITLKAVDRTVWIAMLPTNFTYDLPASFMAPTIEGPHAVGLDGTITLRVAGVPAGATQQNYQWSIQGNDQRRAKFVLANGTLDRQTTGPDVQVKGLAVSQQADDATVRLTWSFVYQGQTYQGRPVEHTLSAVMMDLDGDMNRDGAVDARDPDDPQEHSLPGLCVRINNDDDDGNGTVDSAETSNISEDDLVKIRLKGDPSSLEAGSVVLEAVNAGAAPGRIRVWKAPWKGGTANLVVDSGDAAQSREYWNLRAGVSMADIPGYLYVEGVESCRAGSHVELRLRYEVPSGVAIHEDRLLVSVCPDLPSDVPTTVATNHQGHCLSHSFWDILGEKVVGLAVDGGNAIKSMSASSGDTPCFASREVNPDGASRTRYFMIADKAYAAYSGAWGEMNTELDKYWFNRNTHVGDGAGNHDPDDKVIIAFPNYRAFDQPLFDDRVIGRDARLLLCIYDLDDKAAGLQWERVHLYINGKDKGTLASIASVSIPSEKWQVLEIVFPASDLRFPQVWPRGNDYPEPAYNSVTLVLDETDRGWACEVDWAVIHFDAISPTFLIHGSSQSAEFWSNGLGGWRNFVGDTDILRAFEAARYPVDGSISILDRNADVLGPGNACIEVGGRQVASAIPGICRRHGTFSYNAVGHSKGGLWFRSAWQTMASDPAASNLCIRTVVTLSTPHCGSVLADYVNTFYGESTYQRDDAPNAPATGYLPTSGVLPPYFEEIRDEIWSPDPGDVLDDPSDWNDSYRDLGPVAVNAFNLANVPFIAAYSNADGSRPFLVALSADADLNWNNAMDFYRLAPLWSEWHPLQVSYFPLPEMLGDHSEFFTWDYRALEQSAHFNSAVTPGGVLVFSGSIPGTGTGNDLFVTVDSAAGGYPAGFPPPTAPLTGILLHVPCATWWNGNEPDTVNHGTVCSREAGEYLLSPAFGAVIGPLR